MSSSKTSWPDVVGKTADAAKAAILKDNPKLKVHVLPEGSMVTMDYRTDRVRVFVDPNNKVSQVPSVG